MKIRMKYFIICFLVIALSSCGESEKGTGSGQDSTKKDSSFTGAPNDPGYCKNLKPFQFCHLGLDFIKMGDTLVDLSFPPSRPPIQVPGAVVRDTVFSEKIKGSNEDFSWSATKLKFPDGMVLLEAETGIFLTRVRIETPRYTGPRGIHVGMTVGELKQIYPNLAAIAFHEYNLVELKGDPNFVFHIKNNNFFDVKKTDEFSVDLAKIPDDTKVSGIVLISTTNLGI